MNRSNRSEFNANTGLRAGAHAPVIRRPAASRPAMTVGDLVRRLPFLFTIAFVIFAAVVAVQGVL